MFLKFLFGKKPESIQAGDIVKVKRAFSDKFPSISRRYILKVQVIKRESAVVSFMSDNNIYTEVIPLVALDKVGKLKN